MPLTAASKRLTPKRKPRADRKLTDVQCGIAVGMSAVGVPQNKIAQALSVQKQNVVDAMATVRRNSGDLIVEIRDKLKLTKMQKALLLEEKLWNMADRMIEADDAKAVDGVLRAIHASEKIQAAVSGESQKVEVTGVPSPVELSVLIQQLIQAT